MAKQKHLKFILPHPTNIFKTVRNFITVSIVFTNKNGMDGFNPSPPPQK